MSIRNIIQEIENTDAQAEQTAGRRDILKQWGTKIAMAAVPLTIASLFSSSAKAVTDANLKKISDALNVILRYKYMEADFYTTGIALIYSLISAEDQAAINVINGHETAHVAWLKKTLNDMGAPGTLKPVFDFTANGVFPDVFSSYTTFMAVMQMIEDGGVRIIKGQLANLGGNKTVRAAILRMHTTDARHAAHARMMRRLFFQNKSAKPWITTNQPANIDYVPAQMIYEGEENIAQGNFNITALTGADGQYVSLHAATEAFDEALTGAQSDEIVKLFTA